MLLDFCKDYKRMVVNACRELILIRSCNNNNCLIGDPATNPTFELFKNAVAKAARVIERINKLSMIQALEKSLSEHEFLFVEFV